jgi:hypothetical protein
MSPPRSKTMTNIPADRIPAGTPVIVEALGETYRGVLILDYIPGRGAQIRTPRAPSGYYYLSETLIRRVERDRRPELERGAYFPHALSVGHAAYWHHLMGLVKVRVESIAGDRVTVRPPSDRVFHGEPRTVCSYLVTPTPESYPAELVGAWVDANRPRPGSGKAPERPAVTATLAERRLLRHRILKRMIAAARRAPAASRCPGSKETRWQAAEDVSLAYVTAQEHNDIHAAEDAIQRAAEHTARWYIEDGLPSEQDCKEVPAAEAQTAPAFDDATLQIMLWEAEDAGRENPELMNERSVACESCDAMPGEPCREPSGRVLVTVVHRERAGVISLL